MPKYLCIGTYTHEGEKGLLKEGAAGRRAAVAEVVGSVGGKLDAYYFGLSGNDFYIVLDLPDHASVVAVAAAAARSGAVQSTMTPLMTVEEMDVALAKTVRFRPPGA